MSELDRRPAVSRREFVRGAAAASGALLLAEGASAAPQKRATVVVVSTKADISQEKPPPLALIEQMVEKGVTALAGKRDPLQAWAAFVRPSDRVCLPTAGGQLENVPEVNIAVYKALARLGVSKMTVGTHRMSAAWRERVTAAMQGAIPELISNKLFGIANLPMEALVVTPTVKHHDIAGISGTTKLYGCFSKIGPWNYHSETPRNDPRWDGVAGGGMGACGWVPANDFKEQRKLHVVDMIRVGGTSRGFTALPEGWIYTKSLLFSTDPIAADRVAFDIYLKVARPSGRLDPLYHLERAETEYGAGVADLARIDVRRLTV
jgi:hypothetical protein